MSSSPSPSTRTRVLTGTVAGVLAYALGYVFTYVLSSGDLRDSGLNRVAELATGDDITYQLVGWLFYNAHNVPVLVEVDLPVVGGTDAINFIAQGDGFSPLLYLVPVLLLFGAGLAVGRRVSGSGDPGEAALAGLTVVAGYLPLVLLGTVLFSVQLGSSTGRPDLLPAAALAGVVYPTVVGALGAAVAART